MDIGWQEIKTEAEALVQKEPLLHSYYHAAVLDHEHLYQAIAFQLAGRLSSASVDAQSLEKLMLEVLQADPRLESAALADLNAYVQRDPACDTYIKPLLYFKGFLAIQSHRVARRFWLLDRKYLACYLQSRAAAVFLVDIHPAAKLDSGLMFDHATGIVIGESAEIGHNVSILHDVSLGGSGNRVGKRHPSVGDGVLISVGAKLLGDISVGNGVKIGGGSVVLGSIPENSTVVGVPAKIIGDNAGIELPAFSMDQYIAN